MKTDERFRSRNAIKRKAEVTAALNPSTVFEGMSSRTGASSTAQRLSTQFDTFTNGNTARQLAGGLSAENFANSNTARQLAGGLSAENFANSNTARQLAGGLSAENFINGMPMLGGGDLTDGAIALRAADPIMTMPPSPSERQYMKENELLEHLLYK